jgi:hypothetical protein
MKKNIIIFAALLVGIFFTSNSCTDLKEVILDETSATGLSDKQAADGNLAPVYALLPTVFTHTTLFALQEISSDEAILPYRGGTDWGDNGIYIALHTHTITSADPNVRNTWNTIVGGISRSVTALNSLPTNVDPIAKTYLAEARAMRAYYNLLLLDLWGIVLVKEDLGAISTILRGSEAVEYIKSEFLAAEPNLETNVGPGRMTKAAVWGLLARLHLNAAVYRDPYGTAAVKTEDMDKVIEYTDKIINSGLFQLARDYFSIFNMDNHTNKELVFAVDQRKELNGHNRLSYFSLSGDQFPLAAFPGANGTDGPAITPDFYRTWVNAYTSTDPAAVDPRFFRQNWTIPADSCVDGNSFNMNRGILRGQQYGFIRVNGAFVKCTDGKLKVGRLYNVSRNKPTLPVNFTEQVDYSVAGSNYSQGYRVLKFEFSKGSQSGRNLGDVDIPIVRYGEVYLMRAEAKMRKNDAAGALADVNTVRASRNLTTPPPALTTMNLDLLYRERGFELYWELYRRTDMIRFGKYEDAWTEKSNADKFKRLFPIPQTAIDGASNLPGYLKQNQSY